jgi:hypothetical protein
MMNTVNNKQVSIPSFFTDQVAFDTFIAIVQEEPAISLAIAVLATVAFFPFAVKYWKRVQSRH